MQFNEYNGWNPPVYVIQSSSKKYGILRFLFDLFMIGITGGLWLLWIFVREMRRR